MKIERKDCFRIGASAFLLFLCVHYWGAAAMLLSVLAGAITPLLLGCVIAYIMNILMSFYERHYFPRREQSKTRRPVCMFGAILTVAGVIVLILALVVPQLTACLGTLIQTAPTAVAQLLESPLLAGLLPEETMDSLVNMDWEATISGVLNVAASGVPGTLDGMATAVSSVFSSIVTLVLGMVFALYILSGKERLAGQFHRLTSRYLRPAWEARFWKGVALFDESFHKYVVGQCLEAVILGGLCAVGMMLFGFPYASMIAVLVGVLALIPVAGAYIAAAVGAVMIASVSLEQAILFLLFLVILQQLEGNLIYPRVVGTSVGLPGIWVLAAVTVGGPLFGVVGMLVSVPLAATAYRVIRADVLKKELPSG